MNFEQSNQALQLSDAARPGTPAIRLLVLSDLHLEHADFDPPSPDLYDIAVLAGDIDPGLRAVEWAQRRSTFGGKPVVLVPGNHEFYGYERAELLVKLRSAAAGSNVHLLDRDEVTLHGIRFLGATLWTDFELDTGHGPDKLGAMWAAARGLNDFCGWIWRRQGPDERRVWFAPNDAEAEHEFSRAWLLERLAAPMPAKQAPQTVVVTHHSPSVRSLAPKYVGKALSACFCSELPETFFQTAAVWIHGHLHDSADYRHHRTRVIANPRGYPRRGGFENAGFDPAFVVTLTTGDPDVQAAADGRVADD